MLPFLKQKDQRQPGVIVQERRSDEDKEDDGSEGLHECAKDILSAIHSGDAKRLASALKAAFEICDAGEHEESEHTNEPHSYSAQNQKAGEEK